MKKVLLWCLSALFFGTVSAQNDYSFKQLEEKLPTPNVYRTASGAPGHKYWQQQVDYKIQVTLNDANQSITGSETVTYTNNSPDELTYLWLQLDQNMRAKDSDTYKVDKSKMSDKMDAQALKNLEPWFDGGFKIDKVVDLGGAKMDYTINKTMMRIDLPRALKPGQKTSFKIDWHFNINDRMKIGGRSGYEYFPEDDNYLYTIAQFYPRLCAYMDYAGWQHKQFLGRGEFTLEFGDYDVEITVPADHIVGATGELVNASSVLTSAQYKRYQQARSSEKETVIICTQEEAEKREPKRAKENRTWHFKAENVRDFGWASSRKFIWDAMAVKFGSRTVMAFSLYPKEGNPLWEQYSTKVVAHTLRVYSKYTIDYPYPVAYSIHADRIGMEYPMICFNYGRPEKDGTYSQALKYGMIGVIIHEVGHNFFPMIVNSDERQWTWMDEGLNTFLQYLTEQELERNYPSRRGEPSKIVDYMSGQKGNQMSIMTNSESILQFGNNAYGKPATALNILRETIMGRELFDYAFKEYSRRWAFKHPTPADFFRSMEDASGVDLDWFWRSWFYTTNCVDIALNKVELYNANTLNVDADFAAQKEIDVFDNFSLTKKRNNEEGGVETTYNEEDEKLIDFYTNYDQFKANALDRKEAEDKKKQFDDEQLALINSGKNYYQLTFENVTEMPMPILLEFTYADGTKERRDIPAEIWRFDDKEVTKVFVTDKEITAIAVDPERATADVDISNNYWPARAFPSRFDVYVRDKAQKDNPMQRARKAKELGK